MKKIFARVSPDTDFVDVTEYFDLEAEADTFGTCVLSPDPHCHSYLSDNWKMLEKAVGDFRYYYDEIEREGRRYSSYRSVSSILDDYIDGWDRGKKRSSHLIHEWTEAIKNVTARRYCDFREYEACALLSLYTGNQFVWRSIRGCCQGEYAEVYFPSTGEEDKDDKYAEFISACYFGSGVEVEIHDEDGTPENGDDIRGFFDYVAVPYPRSDEIKRYLVEQHGDADTTVDDVTLFVPNKKHVSVTYDYITA